MSLQHETECTLQDCKSEFQCEIVFCRILVFLQEIPPTKRMRKYETKLMKRMLIQHRTAYNKLVLMV